MDSHGVAEGGDQLWGGLQATPSPSEACQPSGVVGVVGVKVHWVCPPAAQPQASPGALCTCREGPCGLRSAPAVPPWAWGIGRNWAGTQEAGPLPHTHQTLSPKTADLGWDGVGVPLKAQSEAWEVDQGPPEGCAGW